MQEKNYQHGLFIRGNYDATGQANLCAYEQAYAETDAETCAEVVLGPEVVRHVLDDRPICFPLLFVRHRLLG
jgi:hypothetical protein